MQKESKRIIIMIVIIIAVTGFPYLKDGLCAYFPDLMYHLLRTEGVKEALLAGEFPVRIYMNFYNGYGYGSPLFYPDIFLIFPAVLRVLSVSPLATWKIFALTITVIGTLSTYFSVKYICKDSECSMAATFMLMLSQFYLADLHLRAGISEYIAFIFIPILIAGIYDFFVYGGKKTYLMSIAFAGLLLSHSIMTFIGVLITVVIFVRMLFVKREKNYLFDKSRMTRLILAAICTVLVVSYYLFPMLEQMSVLELGYSKPWAHIGKYTQPFSGFFKLIGTFSTIAYIGIGVPILPLILICLFLKKPKNKWSYTFLFGGICLFLITTDLVPWSLLENTILNMLQFTYRFWPYALVFTVIGIAMVLAENLNGKYAKYKKVVLIGIIVCAALAGMLQNRMTAGATSQETKEITEEYLIEKSNYVGAGEWLPLEIEEDVINLTAIEDVISDTGESQQLIRNQGDYSFRTCEKANEYILPLIYYKGYRARIEFDDGSSQELLIDQSENALVQVYNDLGQQGVIHVKYAGTSVQNVSEILSMLTVITILVGILYKCRKGERKNAC